jgi:hypothetical protein
MGEESGAVCIAVVARPNLFLGSLPLQMNTVKVVEKQLPSHLAMVLLTPNSSLHWKRGYISSKLTEMVCIIELLITSSIREKTNRNTNMSLIPQKNISLHYTSEVDRYKSNDRELSLTNRVFIAS